MNTGHEVEEPATDSTPLPRQVDDYKASPAPAPVPPPPAPPAPPGAPTADVVLVAIVGATGVWFPARHAAALGVPRDGLDEPLAELRLAGLIRVSEWVRGLGQGYEPTPEGRAAAADPVARERLKHPGRTAQPAAPAPDATPIAPGAPMLGTAADAELAFDPPLVVPALLVLNALWFFVCVVVSIRWGLTPARALSESHPEVLHRFGAVSGVDLLRGGWWRLLSACFVHIGALHLVVNLFALGMMGPLAELLWGRGRLLLIYFVSGLAGSAMAMTLKPEVAVAGASGAIWGIQMSLFAWLSANRHRLPPDLASDWFRRLCVVLALNAGVSFLPGVSWAGHLGGGAAGFAVAVLLNAARSLDRGRRIGAWVLVALLPLACVAGLAAAMGAKGIPGWHRLQQRLAAETEVRLATERQKLLFDEFRARVLPRVEPLAPEAVKPLEAKAVAALVAQKRSAERVAEIRLQAERLKAIGEALLSDTAGADPSDLYTAKARAIAAARVEAFGLLLGLLGNPNRPTDEEWEAWQRARRKADLLWSHAQE